MKFKDLTGCKLGILTVLSKTDKRVCGSIVWHGWQIEKALNTK
jgi:hypothetical protein